MRRLLAFPVFCWLMAGPVQAARETIPFDLNWRFAKGEVAGASDARFDDARGNASIRRTTGASTAHSTPRPPPAARARSCRPAWGGIASISPCGRTPSGACLWNSTA